MPIDSSYDEERFKLSSEESGHAQGFQDIEYRSAKRPDDVSGRYPTHFGCEACGATARSLETLRGMRCSTAEAVNRATADTY